MDPFVVLMHVMKWVHARLKKIDAESNTKKKKRTLKIENKTKTKSSLFDGLVSNN